MKRVLAGPLPGSGTYALCSPKLSPSTMELDNLNVPLQRQVDFSSTQPSGGRALLRSTWLLLVRFVLAVGRVSGKICRAALEYGRHLSEHQALAFVGSLVLMGGERRAVYPGPHLVPAYRDDL
ncbi:hypothetical protein AGABI1DRAFT_114632 [Agaricus bisporus var. burnettii JB137-S8]|uniref:Uncharacterized protein n=1 Tax=Agaricus bisporus var. burnettii (strain JB137-S8 / ATCC MYA-4627 / FGSC 10392) TaxID=597362 RepID=K5WSD7_AGABU|nr:uncharacterized protein AGABI1DRAFT_114632 [Agaricus bisporus var. burnettii JB137-S8]EKM78331.1 hypothetical protein AGABI1DRAFT_114632 [Agaricus bisporus var. burnettii JB137-S8]